MYIKFIFAFSILFSCFAQSVEVTNKPPKGVSLHQLDNGINVLLIENHGLPMIGINTVVKVGSAYETFASSGMSHMLEHLLFNGTSQWTQKDLYDLTDKIGGYNNANTGEYYTNYMMVTPTENIKKGMEIQAAMLFDSTIPKEKFEKEKGIVLEEIAKSLSSPREKEARSIRTSLFAGHALSLPTLGTYETIKNMDRDDVMAFYQNNYVPNNMEISVIGDFDSEKMLVLLKEIYGHAKPNNVTRPNIKGWATGFEPLPNKPTNNLTYTFNKGKNITVHSFYPFAHSSAEFESLLMDALDKNKDGLQSQLKSTYKEVQSISFKLHSMPVGHYVQADLVLKSDKNLGAINKRFQQLFTEQKLFLPASHIKTEAIKTKTNFLKQIEKPHMFGIYNADLIAQQGLNAIIKQFSGTSFFEASKKLNQFKLNQQPLVVINYPTSKKQENKIKRNKAKLLVSNKNDATIIVQQNGLSELLAIHYLFKHKDKFEEKYGKDAAKIWHELFGKKMKSAEIQKYIAEYGLKFKVNDNPIFPMDDIYLSPYFGYIRVEGLASDSKSAIDFLNIEMLNFKPNKQDFEAAMKKANSGKGQRSKNPSKVLFDKHYNKSLFGSDGQKNAKELTYDSFIAFGESYFTPANMIISVVSKETSEDIKSYFAKFSKQSKVPFSGLAQAKQLVKNNVTISIDENLSSEQALTFYGFIKDIDPADEAALTVLSLILRSDIAFNIREEQGLAYRISSGVKIIKDKALFFVDVPTQPKNVETLKQQFPELLTTEFAEKITQDDLEKTVNKHLGRMMLRRLSSINQAYYLARSLYFDGSIEVDKKRLETLKKVTLEQVKTVAEKYLVAQNPIQIIIN